MTVDRRDFLRAAAPAALLPLLPACGGVSEQPPAGDVFRHGVASGDPLPNAVVIWTRITPVQLGESSTVRYAVARDEAFSAVVRHGAVSTGPAVDYTVKVDVTGLEAGNTYYYAFEALGAASPVGRTKTLPRGHVAKLRLAVASCSNYAFGFFNAYRLIAERTDLDLVLHLGDYIYEYRNGEYGDGSALGRVPEPDHEIVTLEDYRQRHAQYKTDPDLQAAHRLHPFITVWDDHESTNDSSRDGAENHEPDAEGDWEVRKLSAIQAYREWMPIRDRRPNDFEVVFRSFRIGDLADLIMLDTRLYGRDPQVLDPCDQAAINDPARSLLGDEQEAWLFNELKNSAARRSRWRLLGQQVMFGQLMNILAQPVCPFNPDQWDGYAASRARVLGLLLERNIDNVVILTGDIHSSWGMDVSANPFSSAEYDALSGRGSLAVEFVTPGVTSPGIEDPLQAAAFAAAIRGTHPHVKFTELNRRGYMLLDIDHERIVARWYHVAALDQRIAAETLGAELQVRSGDNHITPVASGAVPAQTQTATAG